MTNFICKKISGLMESSQSAIIILSQLGRLATHFRKIPIKMEQPLLGLKIFRNLTKGKINMAPVNMSKSGPIICVNS